MNLQKISAANINLQTFYDDECVLVHVVHPYFILLNRLIVLKVLYPFGHSLTHCHLAYLAYLTYLTLGESPTSLTL